MDVIDLVSSDEEEAKPKVAKATPAQTDHDSDDEVCEVAAPPAIERPSAAAGKRKAQGESVRYHDDDADDDIEFMGHTGDIACQDFPHARENCLKAKFVPGAEEQHCQLCFCFVCDKPVSSCSSWKEHCYATHASADWRRKRSDLAAARIAAANAAPAPAWYTTAAGSSSLDPAASAPAWSCERVLAGVTAGSIYPHEEATPSRLKRGVALRTYQKQTLGFMLDRERSTAPSELGTSFVRPEALGTLLPTGV